MDIVAANPPPGPSFQQPQDVSNSAEPTSSPPKRKPGRPKGSTKKNILSVESSSASPKVKRPVGRPRKDGFPAGSVSAPRSRSSKPRPQHQQHHGGGGGPSMAGVGYPPMTYPGASASAGPPTTAAPFAIDPNLDGGDDWPLLARTNPNAFLSSLLSSLAAPNPVSSAGPSVEEAFKSHLGSLSPNPTQMQPIPSLYSILKTFWLPSSPAYFSLTASASTARTPSEHRFLYWDPQPLVFNGISCPSCSSPLINRGRISTGPIKIYDIDKPFFIIGCEYVCRSPACVAATSSPDGRKFASTDSSILRSLPIRLKDEFPARLMYGDTDAGSGANIWNWKALGVSFALWNLVRGCLTAGLKREAILGLVRAVQHGVPEFEGTGAQEEEHDNDNEEEEEEEEEDAVEDALSGKALEDSSPDLQTTTFVKNFLDAYSDVWKAHSGASEGAAPNNLTTNVGTTAPAPPATPSQPHSVTPAPMPSASPSQAPAPMPATPTPAPPPPPASYEFGKNYAPAPYPYTAYAFFPPPAAGPTPGTPSTPAAAGASGTPGAGKRPYPFEGEGDVNGAGGEAKDPPTKRSPRHCCKCGSQECKGKGGRSFCTNGCQDCGKLECKGRNSRRPDKKCSEGWL